LAIDLSLFCRIKGSSHAIHCKFRRESKGRVLRLRGIFETQRLGADEIFAAVRADRWVRCERNGRGLVHIHTADNYLKSSLLEGISNEDSNTGVTPLRQAWRLAVVLPFYHGLLAASESRRARWRGDIDVGKNRHSEGNQNEWDRLYKHGFEVKEWTLSKEWKGRTEAPRRD